MKNLILLFLGLLFASTGQAQIATKTVNLTTAGTLSTVLTANELSSTVGLTLSGAIDTRDFKTMRDAMPILAEMDLSGVTIVAYNGTEGTINSTDNYSYPANEVPQEAFINSNGEGKTTLVSVVLPTTITSIRSDAFYNCNNLVSVFLPNTLTKICQNAFLNCSKLKDINIPASVTVIEEIAFYNCAGPFIVDGSNPNYSSLNGVLFDKNQITLLQCPNTQTGVYTVPSSVKTIGNYAFENCNNLTTVNMPEGITIIGSSAFFSCSNLTSVSIPSTVSNIGEAAFAYSSTLTSITANSSAPVDLSNVYGVFEDINKNTCTLYVPCGSKSAYQNAVQWKDFQNIVEMQGLFPSTTSLLFKIPASSKSIYIASSVGWSAESSANWLNIDPASSQGSDSLSITVTQNAGDVRTATITIHPTGLANQTITVTQYGAVQVMAGNLATILGDQLISTTNLTLAGTIDARDFKTIRDSMPSLAEINLSGVTIVAYNGAEGTINGTGNYSYPANEVPQEAFINSNGEGKTTLVSVVLPTTITSLGSYAFYNCSNLESVFLPNTLTEIGINAFVNCTKLKDINIPASVTVIRETAFLNCAGPFIANASNPNYSSLNGVLFDKNKITLLQCPNTLVGEYIIPSSVKTVGNYAFGYCDNLTTVNIPEDVTVIGDSAFYYCRNLTSVSIPSTVSKIGSSAFAYTYALTSITANSSVPVDLSNASNVFYNINKTTCTLYVPYGSKSAYQNAVKWKDFQNIVEMQGLFPSTTSLSFKIPASSKSIYIASNVGWSAESSANWLSIDPASSQGSDSLSITVTQNAGYVRTATITIHPTGLPDKTITITQFGVVQVTAGNLATILDDQLVTTSLTLVGTIDARDFKTMRDSMPLLAEIDLREATIVSYSGTEGTDGINPTHIYEANTVPSSAFMKDWQGKKTLKSIVLPNSLTNIDWCAFRDCDGLKTVIIPSTAVKIGGYVFMDCDSLTSVEIPALVTSIGGGVFGNCINLSSIKVYNAIPVDFTITQSSYVFNQVNKTTCILNVPYGSKAAYQNAVQWKDFQNIVEMQGLLPSTSSLSLKSPEATTKIFIASNVGWSAESSANWLSINPASSQGSDSLSISVTQNAGDVRTATITIHPTGLPDKTIAITQYGAVQVTAGNLATILGDQLITTANLTLVGTIDARDFKTMRDSMPSLAEIDLSRVTIVAYNGAEGTFNGSGNYSYPANEVPQQAFVNSNWAGKTTLVSVVFPTTITSIGSNAFYDCSNLESVILPNTLTEIGQHAFVYCSKLKNINIPASVTVIRDYAFVICAGPFIVDGSNPNYSSLNGVLFDKNKITLLQCPNTQTGVYTVPSSVKTIGNSAFFNCYNLSSVIIPEGVTTIDNSAFNSCSNLTSVNIPASVTVIGDYAFRNCAGPFIVNSSNPNYSSLNGVLFDKNKISLLQCPNTQAGVYTVPSSVKIIGNDAFSNCYNLSSVIIPEGVTTIGNSAFYNCSNLTSVSIPSTVLNIGNYAFAYSSALTSITANSSVPVDLTMINDVFNGINKTTCTLYVPYGSKSAYQNAVQWKDFTNIDEMPDLTLSSTTATIAATEGSTNSITVSSNTSWSASSSQSWLTVSPASGTNNGTLVFTAAANTASSERIAIVTVLATGVPSQTITVTQAVGEAGVPLNTTVSSINLASGSVDCFNATDTITVAGNGTTVVFESSSSATLIAGKSIRFLPGFHAQSGSWMDAHITTTNLFCNAANESMLAAQVEVEEKSIDVAETEAAVAIPVEKSIKVYPNPNNGQFFLEVSNFETRATVSIYNMLGSRVYESEIANDANQKINLLGIKKGVYFVKVTDRKDQFTKKIIVR